MRYRATSEPALRRRAGTAESPSVICFGARGETPRCARIAPGRVQTCRRGCAAAAVLTQGDRAEGAGRRRRSRRCSLRRVHRQSGHRWRRRGCIPPSRARRLLRRRGRFRLSASAPAPLRGARALPTPPIAPAQNRFSTARGQALPRRPAEPYSCTASRPTPAARRHRVVANETASVGARGFEPPTPRSRTGGSPPDW